MRKPLVVVAEFDESYLLPLEWRITENLYETVDLEFISSERYLEEYFSLPRTIDLLIIEEEIFRQDLLRHNIKKVFILSEKDIRIQESNGQEVQITYIFKYMNLQTLISIIIPPEWSEGHNKQKETQVVAVFSAEGGAGSTTVALGISACLRQSLKKVFYINAHPYQSFQYLLEDSEEVSMESSNRLHSEGAKVYTDFPQLSHSGYVMGTLDESYIMLVQDARQSGDYDYIVVDIGTYLTRGMISLLEKVNKGIVVTRQQKSSIQKLKELLKNINIKNQEEFFLVCNCFDETQENYCKKENVTIISEYIERIINYPTRKKDLAAVKGLQKLAYLLI